MQERAGRSAGKKRACVADKYKEIGIKSTVISVASFFFFFFFYCGSYSLYLFQSAQSGAVFDSNVRGLDPLNIWMLFLDNYAGDRLPVSFAGEKREQAGRAAAETTLHSTGQHSVLCTSLVRPLLLCLCWRPTSLQL